MERSELASDLLPRLVDRVFHVTDFLNYKEIVKCNELRPNTKGSFRSICGSSSNSYFRLRNCISIFDFRNLPQDESERFHRIYSCCPFPVKSPKTHLVYFYLSEVAVNKLILWTERGREQALGQMIVPHVEAGFPGALPISLIDSILHVMVNCRKSPLEKVLSLS